MKNYARLDKLEEEELTRKSLQLSVHLCIYSIVMVEYYSCNKGEYFVSISHIVSLLQRNLKMSIVYCSALNTNNK